MGACAGGGVGICDVGYDVDYFWCGFVMWIIFGVGVVMWVIFGVGL